MHPTLVAWRVKQIAPIIWPKDLDSPFVPGPLAVCSEDIGMARQLRGGGGTASARSCGGSERGHGVYAILLPRPGVGLTRACRPPVTAPPLPRSLISAAAFHFTGKLNAFSFCRLAGALPLRLALVHLQPWLLVCWLAAFPGLMAFLVIRRLCVNISGSRHFMLMLMHGLQMSRGYAGFYSPLTSTAHHGNCIQLALGRATVSKAKDAARTRRRRRIETLGSPHRTSRATAAAAAAVRVRVTRATTTGELSGKARPRDLHCSMSCCRLSGKVENVASGRRNATASRAGKHKNNTMLKCRRHSSSSSSGSYNDNGRSAAKSKQTKSLDSTRHMPDLVLWATRALSAK